jgi:hypothetical protein
MRKILLLILANLIVCSAAFAASDSALTLDIEKAELQDFLKAYSRFAGLDLAMSVEVKKRHTLITIHPKHPVSVKEAIRLMEDAAKDQAGVVITRLGDRKASATLVKK